MGPCSMLRGRKLLTAALAGGGADQVASEPAAGGSQCQPVYPARPSLPFLMRCTCTCQNPPRSGLVANPRNPQVRAKGGGRGAGGGGWGPVTTSVYGSPRTLRGRMQLSPHRPAAHRPADPLRPCPCARAVAASVLWSSHARSCPHGLSRSQHLVYTCVCAAERPVLFRRHTISGRHVHAGRGFSPQANSLGLEAAGGGRACCGVGLIA